MPRTRKEIEYEPTNDYTGNPVRDSRTMSKLHLEVLLDIRDLLTPKQEEEQYCAASGMILTSNPPQHQCIKCRKTWFVGEATPICKPIKEECNNLCTCDECIFNLPKEEKHEGKAELPEEFDRYIPTERRLRDKCNSLIRYLKDRE